MRPGWEEERYGATQRKIGVFSLTTRWGLARDQKHIATCPDLGIVLLGFDSHEPAQEALEREVEKKLEAALRALRMP